MTKETCSGRGQSSTEDRRSCVRVKATPEPSLSRSAGGVCNVTRLSLEANSLTLPSALLGRVVSVLNRLDVGVAPPQTCEIAVHSSPAHIKSGAAAASHASTTFLCLCPLLQLIRSQRLSSVTRHPENSKRAHLRPSTTPPKFHEKTPKEIQKERKWERERKKTRNCGPPPFGAPPLGGPTV